MAVAAAIGSFRYKAFSDAQLNGLVFLALGLIVGWRWLFAHLQILLSLVLHRSRLLYIEDGQLILLHPYEYKLPLDNLASAREEHWVRGQRHGSNLVIVTRDGARKVLVGVQFAENVSDIAKQLESAIAVPRRPVDTGPR